VNIPARAHALDVVASLNRGKKKEDEFLREYCDAWLRSGHSFSGMEQHKALVNGHLSRWRLWCLGSGVEEMNEFVPSLPVGVSLWNPPERTGGKPALVYGIEPTDNWSGAVAALRFALLIASPEGRLLGRCRRCNAYFLNTSGHRNKVFCTPKCARDVCARQATQAARQQAHVEKLNRVRRACNTMKSKPGGRVDWKNWVSKRTGVSIWWITRATNRGEIRPPKEAR
jgi:hypothetical protein